MLRLELCNLKKLPKKNGGGDVYIATVLAIANGNTALLDNFVDKLTFDKLLSIYNEHLDNDEVTLIDDKYITYRIYNNQLACSVDLSSFVNDM